MKPIATTLRQARTRTGRAARFQRWARLRRRGWAVGSRGAMRSAASVMGRGMSAKQRVPISESQVEAHPHVAAAFGPSFPRGPPFWL